MTIQHLVKQYLRAGHVVVQTLSGVPMDPDDGDNERIIGFDLEGYEATPPSDAEPPRLGDLPADFEVRYRPVVGIYDDESDELWYVVWAAARFQWVGPRAD